MDRNRIALVFSQDESHITPQRYLDGRANATRESRQY
jgi:hypothetical protein